MATFGLITEGKTDQSVIKNVLVGYFNNPDIVVNWLLPLRDETDKHRVENYSNWYKVFEYCRSSQFKAAFQFNDYLILQIDTDASEEKHYDIPKHENGKELSPERLIERVKAKFVGLMGKEFYDRYKDRIIFAIAVHSIECWLLPLYYSDKKRSAAIKGCLDRLNRQLQRKEGFVIKDKHPDDYERISIQYCRHNTLMRLYPNNPSFKIFIEEIQRRNIVIEEEDF